MNNKTAGVIVILAIVLLGVLLERPWQDILWQGGIAFFVGIVFFFKDGSKK